ncbi:hypothetical protein [Acuticoccus kandeliae]|uniref:hypothetical protein n=1 Tax=Acuticoccus kandeliae TaxID=2073160 RepID=UPI001300A29D|nr:hypothetical protein [Acuticoccus kandeliae]
MWQNPRRAIYEIADDGLLTLQNFLSKSSGKGNARDLEFGVAWLLWMLGFSVAHLGGTSLTQDAVDIVAAAPSGNLAIIECTTGLLKAENKLANLVARCTKCKEQVARTGQSFLRVLPVIVTSRTQDEIVADIESAERLGVLVISQEDLLEAVTRTLQFPDPERIFLEGERQVSVALEKYRTAE